MIRCSSVLVTTILLLSTSRAVRSFTEGAPDSEVAGASFSSKIGSLVPEYALPANASVPLVKVASRVIGLDAWPVTPRLLAALQAVSQKLSVAMQAQVSTVILPTPLGFTAVRGLGLQEGQHLADAPCVRECTKELYPQQEDFDACYACGKSHPFQQPEYGSIEIVFEINYTRSSLLLGGVQSTLSTTCVSLLEEEGMKVRMVGSTFRLLPAAKPLSRYLPLDTISLRYVAWQVLVELRGPNITPFTVEKENLILGLWQLQQAGQDFRIKQAKMKSEDTVVLHFVTNHLPITTGDHLVKVWQGKMGWLSQQLNNAGLEGCQCRLLKAHEVYDETMADQFRIMAGTPRRPISIWPSIIQCAGGLVVLGLLTPFLWKHKKGLTSSCFPEMTQFASGLPGDRHHLKAVPMYGNSGKTVDITVCQRADGSDWLLGAGSSGKVFKGLKNDVQQVAIKVIDHTDAQQLAEFAKEIELLRSLSFDANIVQFYGACLQEENTMMVLEYMAGGDLMDAIAADSKNLLRWSRKGHILAMDIVKGLVHLQANKIIHMDLKSKNILLNKDHTLAKIADVGLSRGMQSSNKGFTPGTLEYSAPEVLLGRFCNGKADIFSYGVILWEIVTHEQPQRGGLRDCKVPQECPAEIDQLINQCLAHEPEDRPTAKEIYETIRQWRVSKEVELKRLQVKNGS
ncbi:hypothetical protein ABBQ38_001740 [Trebouxia sp. C0009 RCD-2024]